MKRNYNLSYRLIAFILFVGLFLQSCGSFQNQVIPQSKKQPSRTLELSYNLSENPLVNTDKEIVTSDGYLAFFYEECGELKADLKVDERQPKPNYEGIPVVVEEGTDLASLIKLDPTTQKNRIKLNRSHDGKLRHIFIRKGGVLGGMMEGDEEVGEKLEDEAIPNECFCPITQEIMEDPVIAQDGHTYERSAIQRWFDIGKRTSPKTGARLLSIELIPNYTMRSLIQDLKAQMPVLARHKLNIDNIEAAIKLREEDIQQELELKGNLLLQEQQKVLRLEEQLAALQQQTAQISLENRAPYQLVSQIQAGEGKEKEKEKESQESRIDGNIVFYGNGGVGKSLLCNSVFGTAIFKSDVSLATRTTAHKQEYAYQNTLYIDTFGLDDAEMVKKAAEEIEEALQRNKNYKVIFVATLEHERIKPSDLFSISTVCELVKTPFQYGLIFNKVEKLVIEKIKQEGGLDRYLRHLNKQPSSTLLLEKNADMENRENAYFPMDTENRRALLNFIHNLRAINISDKYSGREYFGHLQGRMQPLRLENKMEEKEKEKQEREELRINIDNYFFRHATKKNIDWGNLTLPDLSNYNKFQQTKIVAAYYKHFLYDENCKYGGWMLLSRTCYKRNAFKKLLSPEEMGFTRIEPTCYKDPKYDKQLIRYLRDGLLTLVSLTAHHNSPFYAQFEIENNSDRDIEYTIPKGQILETAELKRVQNLTILSIIKFDDLEHTKYRLQSSEDKTFTFTIKAKSKITTEKFLCACIDPEYAMPNNDNYRPTDYIHNEGANTDPKTKTEPGHRTIPNINDLNWDNL